MAKQLRITQTKSVSGRVQKHRDTIKALGLGRPHYSVVHNDTPQIRGMVKSVEFMVKVEEIDS
jgi:large subunit ribosomal protein L30